MSVVKRIYFSMGAMILLICAIGAIAISNTGALYSTFSEYRDTARSTALATQVTADLLEARIAELEFRAEQNPAALARVAESLAKVLHDQEELVEALETMPEATALDTLKADLAAYETTIDVAAQLQARRNALVARTAQLGDAAHTQLQAVMESAFRDDDARDSFHAGVASAEFSLGRLFLERYIVTHAPEDFATSAAHMETVRQEMDTLLAEVTNRERMLLSEGTLSDVTQFTRTAQELSETIAERNAAYGKLGTLGAELIDLVDQALQAISAQQRTIGNAGSRTAQAATTLVIWIVALGTLAGLIVAFRVARRIRRDLTGLTAIMSDVAGGNLDVELAASSQKHELAQMKNALVVFLETARKTRDLTAQMANMEELEKERAAAEQDRKARAEAEASAAAEREATAAAERTRMAALEAFQRDMEQVITGAADGDLAQRMDETSADPNLKALSGVVNQLLHATQSNITSLVQGIGALADGDLSTRIDGDQKGVFLQMKLDFNEAMQRLASSLGRITRNGFAVSAGSSELESAALGMAKRAEDTAAAIEETSAAVEEVTASVTQVVANAKAANAATQTVQENATRTRDISAATETAINAMSDASAEIDRVVGVIEDIAFQINLLALNAGVEAARAGEAGRGFSVVASEVRSLALRSQDAVHEINGVITQNTRNVEESVAQVGLARAAVDEIATEIEVASGQIAQIALAVEQQSQGVNEVNASIQSIDAASRTNAAALEEMTAASVSLSEEARGLADTLAGFTGVETGPDLAQASEDWSRNAEVAVRSDRVA